MSAPILNECPAPNKELNDNMSPAIAMALRKYHEINRHLSAGTLLYQGGDWGRAKVQAPWQGAIIVGEAN